MTVPGPRNAGRREDRGGGVQRRRPNVRRFRYGGKALCALGVCLLLVTMVGPSASASKKGLSGTLTMNVFTFTTPVMKPVIAAFEKANPGVHISAANVVNTPSTYVPLLQTERLAGNLPMINETYDVLTPTLEVDGLIGDLTPDLKAGKPYPQSYWLPTFEASYIPPVGAPFGVGHVFALANEADATVIMINKDEFAKAGVPLPKNGWTWNQMLADAAKLKVGSGASQTQYGICERPDWQAEYNPVLKAYGVTAFTETKATLDTPAALKAWKLMIDPMLNGDAVPEAQQQAKNGSSGCEPFFESGEAAMSIEVRGNLPGLHAGHRDEVRLRRRADAVDHGCERQAGRPDRWRQPRLDRRPERSEQPARARVPEVPVLRRGPGGRREDVRRRAGRRLAERPDRALAHTAGRPREQRGLRDRRQHGDDRPADPGHGVHALEHRYSERGHGCDYRPPELREGVHEPAVADGRRVQAQRLACGPCAR